jgi:hypothetical protein
MHGPKVANNRSCNSSLTTNGLEGSSGALRNLKKPYFFQLAANVIRDVNVQRGKNRILYAKKAMIWCGMSLGLDRLWIVQQLSRELQMIVAKYNDNFEGAEIILGGPAMA